MSPIYQTMTGGIQCVVHEGVLMVREWPDEIQHKGPNPFPWERADATEEGLRAEWEAAQAAKDDRASFRAGCKTHCLTGRRPSSWYMEPKSLRLAREIEELMAQAEEAAAREIADRPDGAPHPLKGQDERG